MKCTEYNKFSILCQGCSYPEDIKCCKVVSSKVYLILDIYDGRIKCCFRSKEKADQYNLDNCYDYFVQELEVIE